MMIFDNKKENKNRLIRTHLVTGLWVGASLFVSCSVNAAVWLPEELAVVDMVNLQRGFHNLDPLQTDDRLHDSALGHSQSMADYNYFSHTTLAGPNVGSNPANRISAGGYDFTGWGENIAAGQGRAAPFYNTPSGVVDAAHDVMYGTEDFDEINNFFTSHSGVSASGWDDLGDGLSGSDWDAWYDQTGGSGGWMGSSGHRNAILNSIFDDLGVGYVWDADDTAPILLDGGNTFDQPLYSYWTQHFALGDSVETPAPVPLPGAVWLLGSGLIGMMWAGRKKKETL
jgi:uncharacterized protein YkwD